MKSVTVRGVTMTCADKVVENNRYALFEDSTTRTVNSITVLKAGQRTRGHYHPHCETYRFEAEGLRLVIDDTSYVGLKDSTINIRPNQFHQVINDTDQDIAFLCQWDGTQAGVSNYTKGKELVPN